MVNGPDHPRELLGGYVLGALEPREAARVRRHLRRCRECRHAYDRLAAIPSLIDLLEPSEEGAPEPPPDAAEAWDLAQERARRRRPWWRRRAPLRLAVAAATGALLVVGVAWLSADDDGPPTVGLVGRAGSATARLEPTVSGTRVSLRTEGLAPTRGDEVYEVWFLRGRARVSAGSFMVGPSGRMNVELTTAGMPGDYDRIDVTREPDARDHALNGPSVLSGAVRR